MEPQSVRVSLIEGDVRVQRGKKAEKETGNTWEQAQVNLPIEAGFSLVTGNGRAEIEFEDASTVYLGESSVLTFGKVTSKGGVTQTDLQLVNGTLSINFIPGVGDTLSIASPTDNFVAGYPDKLMLRFNSFVDALGITPLRQPFIQHIAAGMTALPVGSMSLIQSGHLVTARMARMNNYAFRDWDGWVAKRVTLRAETMTQTMGQSGLDAPVAGLADLEGRGDFFDCTPYGRCWQPTGGWSHGLQDGSASSSGSDGALAPVKLLQASGDQTSGGQTGGGQNGGQNGGQTVSVAALQNGTAGQVYPQSIGYGPGFGMLYDEDYFPCGPDTYYPRWLDPYQSYYPWDWAVCHAGSWIHRGNGYAWVVQRRRHHNLPVRWVKVNGKPAFVPLHPRDEKGKPPINLKNGLFSAKAVTTDGLKHAESSEHVAYNEAASLKLLDEAPKNFRQPAFAPLRAAAEPRIEARTAKDGSLASAYSHAPSALAAHTALPAANLITFDHKSESFVTTRQTFQEGHSVMVKESLGGGPSAIHGDHGGDHSGLSAGGGTSHGFSGGSAGGGNHGSSGGGGFSGGAASHGGGGSSSAGGGGSGGASHGSSGGGGGSSSGGAAAGGGHPGH